MHYRAKVASKQFESEVYSLRLELSSVRQKQLDKKIAVVAKDISFSAQDLAQELAVLAGKESEVQRQLREVGALFRELKTNKGSADAVVATGRPAAVESGSDAWRVAVESYQSEVLILDQRLETLTSLEQLWKRWYQLANKPLDRATLVLWQDESRELLHGLEDQARALAQKRDVVRQGADTLAHLGEGAKRAEVEPEIRRELLDVVGDSLAEINSAERTIQRFREALSSQIERSGTTFDNLSRSLLALVGWKVAGTEGHSITFGKLVLLIVAVTVGIVAAYYASRWIGRIVFRRLGLSRGKAVALRSIVFYALCLVSGVVAFRLLNVPLAAFALIVQPFVCKSDLGSGSGYGVALGR